MKLKVFRHLEEAIVGKCHAKTKAGRLLIESVRDVYPADTVCQSLNVVDYRIHIGARVKYDASKPNASKNARQKVSALLAREMFDDIREELLDLHDWAFQEGYDHDLIERIERLVYLVEGRDV